MQRGVIRTAVNLGWQNLALRDQLASRYQLPVHLANDSQMAALAEYTFGQSQMEANLIVIKVGRGISAGIILNGQLYRGGTAGASEIGHVRVVEGGERCLCGHFGCLETVASSQALVRQAKGDPSLNLRQVVTSPQTLTTDTVLAAFQNGDESIRQIILGVGHYLGIAVANLVGALNIQHIIIGGSLARFGETLLEAIRAEMRERVLPLIAAETRVELSSLGQNLVIIGAAALLLSRELEVV
jgi:predicted NBD/HSP70 family sugar kinase